MPEIEEELKEFRKQKDQFFTEYEESPLTPEQKRAFTGLNYYPYNADMKLLVMPEEYQEKQTLQMVTTTGEVASYARWGHFSFFVEGQEADLTIYEDLGGDGFFLPFMDATNGEETYSGGRYLDLEMLLNGCFDIDFNYAYNPYCAYNERWSCPIPPQENRLNVPIKAGEKAFK